ncbi:MAG: hypothetical protein II244_07940 [Clostridia bacterium]|nr:hypothetical protein [Clostridia bacterium]
MDNINKLIAELIAICSFCKDIHYNSKGDAFYGKHLLADRVQENINEYIDQIKEICILGNDEKTLPSAEYLLKATSFIPAIQNEDKANFKSLENLLINTLSLIERMEGTKGEENLYGNIAQDLQNSLGLINRQIK